MIATPAIIAFLLKHWRELAVAGLIIGLGLFVLYERHAGYEAGRKDTLAEVEAQAQKLKDAEIAKASTASTSLEKDNANAQVIYRDREKIVTKIVDHSIYRNVCFDPDGLSVANSALTGSPPTSSQSDFALSRPNAP